MKRGKEAEEGEVESTCRSPGRRQTPFSRTCSFAKAAVPALTMDLASPFLPAVGCHVKNSFDQGFDQGFDHFIIIISIYLCVYTLFGPQAGGCPRWFFSTSSLSISYNCLKRMLMQLLDLF